MTRNSYVAGSFSILIGDAKALAPVLLSDDQWLPKAIFCCDDNFVGLSDKGHVFTWRAARQAKPSLNRSLAAKLALEGVLISSVGCGKDHVIALSHDGEIFSWGRDSQCHGHAEPEPVLNPRQILNLAGYRIVEVSCGRAHTLALSDYGGLWSWGVGKNGRLGHGDTSTRLLPTEIRSLYDKSPIQHIATGRSHSVGITGLGTVYTFGRGLEGQLGIGKIADCTIPTCVHIGDDKKVVAVACGRYHTLALTTNGEVYSWGQGGYGALGTSTDACPEPLSIHEYLRKLDSPSGRRERINSFDSEESSLVDMSEEDFHLHSHSSPEISAFPAEESVSSDALPDPEIQALTITATPSKRWKRVCGSSRSTKWAVALLWRPSRLRDGKHDSSTASLRTFSDPSPLTYEQSSTFRGDDGPGSSSGAAGKTCNHDAQTSSAFQDAFIISIAAGDFHSAAVSASGEVYTWGYNACGQLGLGKSSKMVIRPRCVSSLRLQRVRNVIALPDCTIFETERVAGNVGPVQDVETSGEASAVSMTSAPAFSRFGSSRKLQDMLPKAIQKRTIAAQQRAASSRTQSDSTLCQQWLKDVLPNLADPCRRTRGRQGAISLLRARGIPFEVRGRIWNALVGNALNITRSLFAISVERAKQLGGVPCDTALGASATIYHARKPSLGEIRCLHNLHYPRPSNAHLGQRSSAPRKKQDSQKTKTNEARGNSSWSPLVSPTTHPKAVAESVKAGPARRNRHTEPAIHHNIDTSWDNVQPRRLSHDSVHDNAEKCEPRVGSRDVPPSAVSRSEVFGSRPRVPVSALLGCETSMHLIDTDVRRTFSDLALFHTPDAPLFEPLRDLLRAFVVYRPDIGYVQGMSYVAAVLLLHMDRYSSFACFANLMNRHHFFVMFRFEAAEIKKLFNVFEVLLSRQLPALFSHFHELEITPDMYLLDWFLTLFSKSLPLHIACRIWDWYLLTDETALFKAAVGLLSMFRSELEVGDFDDCVILLRNLPRDIDESRFDACVARVAIPAYVSRSLYRLCHSPFNDTDAT
eukprot:Rmarinus@m.14304